MVTTSLPNHWINPNRLRKVVSLMLGSKSLKLKDWHYEPILGGLEFTNAIYRCHGVADSGDQTIPWSLITKITSKEDQSNDPKAYRYWKREALAYQSDLITSIPEHLSAPQVYAVDENSDDAIVIWMEDLNDDFQGHWPIEVYEEVAYQLGLYNSSNLTQQHLPNEDWMTLDWLKKYVEHAAPAIELIKNNPDHPVVNSKFAKSVHFILSLWEIRMDLFDYLDKMPQVFCHQDTITRNLFINKGHLTAIDWGYAGIAPLGTDLVPLSTFLRGLSEFPQEQAYEIDRVCFDAYLRGIKTNNPHISARSLRRSVLFILLLRYILGVCGELVPALMDKKSREYLAEVFGKTEEELTQHDEFTNQYFQSKALEAVKLMSIKTKIKFFFSLLYFNIWYKRHAELKT
jgi:hypothetical protein